MDDSTNESLLPPASDKISDHEDLVHRNERNSLVIEEDAEECKPASGSAECSDSHIAEEIALIGRGEEETQATQTDQLSKKTRFSSSNTESDSPKKKKIVSFEDQRKLQLIREAEIAFLVDSTSGGKVTFATLNRCEDIATAIYLDDDRLLNRIIRQGPPLPKEDIQRRILEAVELNSLKCLDVLCELYAQNPVSSKLDVKLFYRRYGHVFWKLEDRPKETALHVLARNIALTKAVKVLERRPKFLYDFADVEDSHKSTPLLIAIKCNNIEVAKRLLPFKPDISRKNRDSESPIHMAALNDHVDLIKEILKTYCEPEEIAQIVRVMRHVSEDGRSLLHLAAQSGKPKVLNFLMEQSFLMELLEKEKTSQKWKNFVGNVCACGCKELAKIIFEEDPSVLFEDDVTPFMRAAEANQYEIVKLILEIKPDLHLFTNRDRNGRNVFHYAVKNPKVLEYLLLNFTTMSDDFEAINQMDNFEDTPIKLAAVKKLDKSFAMLINYTTKELDIFSAHLLHEVHIKVLKTSLPACKTRYPEEVANLLRGEHEEHQPLLDAAKGGSVALMEFFLNEGANPLQRTSSSQTALHCAVLSGNLAAVEFLLAKGEFLAMIDFIDEESVTAAGYATQTGQVEILQCLLDRNAQMKSDKMTGKLNILDSAYGYFTTGQNCIREIVKFCTKDKKIRKLQELLEDSHFGPDGIMAKLIEETPDVALEIFDLCIYQDKYLKHLSYGKLKVERRVAYTFFPFNNKHDGRLESIESMVNYKRDDCLRHPLVMRFLNEKVNSCSVRSWILLNMFVFATFLHSLTIYSAIQIQGVRSWKSPGMMALSVIILIICAYQLMQELFQLAKDRYLYGQCLQNYIEWVMYVGAMIYVVPGDSKADVQVAAGAIAVFLSWMNFSFYLLRQFSSLGVYIIMAKRVFVTVFKVLPLVILFIVAFSLSLSLLMPQDEGFNTILISLLTTFVMMTGELDYRDTFLASGPLHVLQKIFLVLFILMISIAIMNLFTGLAVGDANEIMSRSKEESRIYKATIVLNLERTFRNLPFLHTPTIRYFVEDHPDMKENTQLLRLWWSLYHDKEIEEQLKPIANEKEKDYGEQFDELKQLMSQNTEEIRKIRKALSQAK